MSQCPVSRRDNPDVYFCLDLPGKEICQACPAYDWRVKLILWWRDVRWYLKAVLPIAFAMMLAGVSVLPASADHNPEHSCPAAIAQAVLSGAKGGTFYGNESRVTWSDGSYICIFSGGAAKTFFKSRNALTYLAKDALRHGAQAISQSKAAQIVKGAMSAPVVVMPPLSAYCRYLPDLPQCTRYE